MRFLNETLNIQGIKGTGKILRSDTSVLPEAEGFIVRHWTFLGSGSSGDNDYPYMNGVYTVQVGDSVYFNFRNSTTYFWKNIAEVHYTLGTPGQNNPKPAALFTNHQFIWVEQTQTWYDPSYGLKYFSVQDMDATLSGFFRFGNDASFLLRTNPSGVQVKIEDIPLLKDVIRIRMEVR